MEPLKKRAVMVWIHGGGFFMGSGDATFYGPEHLVRKDVVLVTLNYRLGVLGKLLLVNSAYVQSPLNVNGFDDLFLSG